jgi:carboxylesterase
MERTSAEVARVAVLAGAEPFLAEGGPVGALMLHGFTGSTQSIRPWAESLAAAGLTVYAPRLPGHGTRWQAMARTRWSDWYAEALRAFESLRSRCDQVFVCGLSMGGTLALRLAEERRSDVAGVVVVNASLGTDRADAKLLPVARLVIPAFPGIVGDIKSGVVAELGYDKLPLKPAYSLSQAWKLVRDDLDRISAPMLVFRSREDHIVPPVSGQYLLEGARSTEVRERILEDSYHVATLDADAPMIFAETVDFVRQHAPALGAPDAASAAGGAAVAGVPS